MQVEGGINGRYGPVLFAVATLACMGYLVFAAVQGDYGLVRLFQVESVERQLAGDIKALREERLMLENLSERLSSSAVDLELLEERARAVLGLVHENEIVIR